MYIYRSRLSVRCYVDLSDNEDVEGRHPASVLPGQLDTEQEPTYMYRWKDELQSRAYQLGQVSLNTRNDSRELTKQFERSWQSHGFPKSR